MNVEIGTEVRAIPFLGIFKWVFVAVCTEYSAPNYLTLYTTTDSLSLPIHGKPLRFIIDLAQRKVPQECTADIQTGDLACGLATPHPVQFKIRHISYHLASVHLICPVPVTLGAVAPCPVPTLTNCKVLELPESVAPCPVPTLTNCKV